MEHLCCDQSHVWHHPGLLSMPGRTGPVFVSQVILAKNAETMTLTSQILELSWLSCRLSKKKQKISHSIVWTKTQIPYGLMGLFMFLRLAFTFFRATPRPIPPEDLEVPLWFAAREASLQRDDRPFPFGKCGRLPGQKKSTGTDGSLMMIDDPWWFHNSMTQWHPMTILDGFLSKSKALRRPNYAITFCLGKNSEWPLQKRIGHGPTMSKYVQVPGTPWNSSKWVPRFGQMPPVGLWPNLTRQKKSARCERSALSAGGTGWDLWELERILTSTGHLGDKYSGQWVQHMN